ncbi:MAG TPA: WbqC family protein [Saprospiraceae bacterium]|nr:WbqC family protein [Saprospiraceae bacterium]HMQ82450.1 WbqC family protein [Saprospiraceae bacterium]
MQALIELHYLPSVPFFQLAFSHEKLLIEQHEHYQKNSFRNRCYIATANGLLCLSIPLRKGKNEQQAILDVRIAHDEPWQQRHWRGIQSAYGNAPYFVYYADAIAPFFQRKYDYLFEWNWDLLQLLFRLLSLDTVIQKTTAYDTEVQSPVLDYREQFKPGKLPSMKVTYPQLFVEKHGFLPNLSILDLLFCVGPQASMYLSEN